MPDDSSPTIPAPSSAPVPTIKKRSEGPSGSFSAGPPRPTAPAAPVAAPTPAPTPPAPAPVAATPPAAAPAGGSGLESIRDKALQELSPLLDQAEFDPVEKFDIYMRLIRANNDPALLDKAHEMASQIQDPEEKAKALYDIVTEVDFQLQDQEAA